MPLFQSLSFVINDQIRQNQIIINSGLSLRSNVSQQFQIQFCYQTLYQDITIQELIQPSFVYFHIQNRSH